MSKRDDAEERLRKLIESDIFKGLSERVAEMRKDSLESFEEWPPPEWPSCTWLSPTGLKCLIVAGPLGTWNGYVCLPPSHVCHGLYYDSEAYNGISVHGGLTYCQLSLDGFWVGFDTAHAGDFIPGCLMVLPNDMRIRHFKVFTDERYWRIEDVKAETEHLAEQLAKLT